MSNIYLIRHTQQIDDFIPTQNQPYGPPLAPRGIVQAEHLRDRLAATREIQADILIASPLLRARTTADQGKVSSQFPGRSSFSYWW